jgi:hypothetical protein
MIATGASELHGKTIEDVAVYTDAVLMTLTDGRAVAIFDTPDGLRVQVAARISPQMPVGVRVYPGQFPYPGELPEYARRRR